MINFTKKKVTHLLPTGQQVCCCLPPIEGQVPLHFWQVAVLLHFHQFLCHQSHLIARSHHLVKTQSSLRISLKQQNHIITLLQGKVVRRDYCCFLCWQIFHSKLMQLAKSERKPGYNLPRCWEVSWKTNFSPGAARNSQTCDTKILADFMPLAQGGRQKLLSGFFSCWQKTFSGNSG